MHRITVWAVSAAVCSAVLVLCLLGSGDAPAVPRPPAELALVGEARLRAEHIEEAYELTLDGDVLVASEPEFGYVWVMDAASRRVLWSRQLTGHSRPALLSGGDMLVPGTARNSDVAVALERLDRRTGRRVWRWQLGNGYLTEDGYVVAAGDLAAVGYFTPRSGEYRVAPTAIVGLNLRSGRSLAPAPRYPAQIVRGLTAPPRFLASVPYLPELGSSDYRGPEEQTYRVKCLDARRGTTLWTASIGRLRQGSSRRAPRQVQVAEALGSVALYTIVDSTRGHEVTELTWVGLRDGRILRRSRLAGAGRPDWLVPVVRSTRGAAQRLWLTGDDGVVLHLSGGATPAPARGLSEVALLGLRGTELSLRSSADPARAIWRAKLAAFLPRGATDTDHNLDFGLNWPFATLTNTDVPVGGRPQALLVDLRTGAVQAIPGGPTAVCLDSQHGALYTLDKGRLRKYRLPGAGTPAR